MEWDMERLNSQIKFIMEIDRLKQVYRQTYLSDASRKENDTEHSWHLAVMAMLLGEYANEKIDVLKTMSMVLIHDIVEIDAGDTYAYDDAGNATKREREVAAADRIFNILPADQAKYLRNLWDEFEEDSTPEARFAHTLDHVQPVMLNDASGAKAWKEHAIKLSQVLKRNSSTAKGSEKLWEYTYNNFIEPNVKTGSIEKDIDYKLK